MASTLRNNGPILLWKETHPKWGWLSNWYEAPFHTGDKDLVYQTIEQYMMQQKALLFSDIEIADKIMAERSPEKIQALGRQVKNFVGATWVHNRERIVEEGSYHKYTHSLLKETDLKAKLLATDDRELVEASPVDRIWGVGFDEQNAEANRPGWGLNLLGKVLTRVRRRIREEEQKSSSSISQ